MREMRDSGVNWIGLIPTYWQVCKLKYIADIQTGNTPPKSEQSKYYSNVGIPWIKAEDLDSYQPITTTAEYLSAEGAEIGRIFQPFTVYVSCIASIGKTGFSSIACSCNQQINAIKFRNAHWKYGFYLTIAQESEYIFNATGNVVKILNSEKQSNIMCTLPPIDEQSLIVDYLDNKCLLIDSYMKKQVTIIEKLKEYKRSIITEVVTKGLNPCVKYKKTNVEWLGQVPAHWPLFRVASLYYQTNDRGNDDLPILTVSINSGISDRELDDDEQDRIFARSEDRTKYKRVSPGDLAYNMMRAWQGAFGAVRVNGMVSPAYITCRPKVGVDIDTRYIEYLFRSPMAIEEMHRHSHGVADFRLRLYWPEFKNIQVCLPPLVEQIQIADYIDKTSTAIDKEISRIQKTIDKLNNYKKSVIYEVVTGKKEVCSL